MHSSLNRRQFLSVGALALTAAGLAGCSSTTKKTTSFVRPDSAAVTAAEAKRRRTGTVVQRALTAEPITLDLGGKTAKTWAYRGASATEPLRGNEPAFGLDVTNNREVMAATARAQPSPVVSRKQAL